jgi:putative transposase
MSRGNRQEPIYLDDRDRQVFLRLLETVVERFEWICLSYCLLDNHFHLLIETPQPNLVRGMQRLKGRYGRWFNNRYGLLGHVFQGRYGSKLVVGEAYRLQVARYIALNPVVAGLVRAPEEAIWSSYPATIGQVRAPSFLSAERLLEPFGSGWVARARFKAFVEDGLRTARASGDVALGLTPGMAQPAA